jgi:hypothetical protein
MNASQQPYPQQRQQPQYPQQQQQQQTHRQKTQYDIDLLDYLNKAVYKINNHVNYSAFVNIESISRSLIEKLQEVLNQDKIDVTLLQAKIEGLLQYLNVAINSLIGNWISSNKNRLNIYFNLSNALLVFYILNFFNFEKFKLNNPNQNFFVYVTENLPFSRNGGGKSKKLRKNITKKKQN